MKPIFATGGIVSINGREFPVVAPSATDLNRIRTRMRELAMPECLPPLLAVNAVADQLLPGVLTESLALAIKQGSGGGAEPTADLIDRQFETLAGIRFQFWYLARKLNKDLKVIDVEALVTEDNCFDVADALIAALKPSEDAEAPKASPAGAPS